MAYSKELIKITEPIKVSQTSAGNLKSLISRKLGFPISVFRLVSPNGSEMFNCHTLDKYEINIGDIIRLEIWDGMNNFLKFCLRGFYKEAMEELSKEKGMFSTYFLKVGLYISAHYGFKNLGIESLKRGAKPGEPVGEHPLRIWNKLDHHLDSSKSPIHEAAEFGQLLILKEFINSDMSSIFSLDGNGYRPIVVAMKHKQKQCVSFLVTAECTKINYEDSTFTINLVHHLRKWANRGRAKVLLRYGYEKSSLKTKEIQESESPRVGHIILLKGFESQGMNSKSREQLLIEVTKKEVKIIDAHKKKERDKLKEYCKKLTRTYENKYEGKRNQKFPKPPFVRLGVDKEYLLAPLEKNLGIPSKHLTMSLENKENIPIFEDHHDAEEIFTYSEEHEPESQLLLFNNSRKMRANRDSISSCESSLKEKESILSFSHRSESKISNSSISRTEQVENRKSKMCKKFKSERTIEEERKRKNSKQVDSVLTKSENTFRRPFYFVPRDRRDLVKETLSKFEKLTGLQKDEIPVHCLSIASRFNKKPWLKRVNLAMNLTKKHVSKQIEKMYTSEEK